jgi:hypothetical protein
MGGGSMPQANNIDYNQQMALQKQQQEASERLMRSQMEEQRRFQIEMEERLKVEQERQRQAEIQRRQELASKKAAGLQEQEARESAVSREIMGQVQKKGSSQAQSEVGLNLDMPTIERPGYEQEGRPL